MRKGLKPLNEHRLKFSGTFERFGTKVGYNGKIEKTVLLVEIKAYDGAVVTDHLWFNYTTGFQKLALKKGDIVQFDARVQTYAKGYRDERSTDYHLTRPTKVALLRRKDD